MKSERGFTLPELVVTVFVLVVLLIVSAVLLRPVDYSAQEQQATRYLDAARIMQAITRYQQDTGELPADLPLEPVAIGNADGAYDLCKVLVPRYLKDIPLDPVTGIKSTDTDDATKLPCSAKGVGYLAGYSITLTENGVEVGVVGEQELLDLSERALPEAPGL